MQYLGSRIMLVKPKAITIKRVYCSKNLLTIAIITPVLLMTYLIIYPKKSLHSEFLHRSAELYLEAALAEDKGTGCYIPKSDPFSSEVMMYMRRTKPITCNEKSWVTCYMSKCELKPEIINKLKNIECFYSDIIHISDQKRSSSTPKLFKGDRVYNLIQSDHVKIHCTGLNRTKYIENSWSGFGTGFRSKVELVGTSDRTKYNYDVLILGFAKTSKNGFIRKMPISYKLLTKFGATVLNGYNVLREGSPSTMFPILSGKTEFEMLEARNQYLHDKNKKSSLDERDFIFHKIKQLGYRTAYFEDRPWTGPFHQRFNGFRNQPADHYSRDLFMEEFTRGELISSKNKLCYGDTPRFKLMINLTDQFFHLDGKHFSFTFIGDISYNNFNLLGNADKPLAEFLERIEKERLLEKTFLIVMGEHGPRFADFLSTDQGKLEDRLPFMAIRLPDKLKAFRPEAQAALEANIDVLTTPHDIYATILDVLNLKQFWNPYKVKGADFPRALTLLQPVPRNRSCSEAGIEPYWCTCHSWEVISRLSDMFILVAGAVVDQINNLTQFQRHICSEWALESVESVKKRVVNREVVRSQNTTVPSQVYQVEITVRPESVRFEATVIYLAKENEFLVNHNEVHRKKQNNKAWKCKLNLYPYLSDYCYCES